MIKLAICVIMGRLFCILSVLFIGTVVANGFARLILVYIEIHVRFA